MRSSIFNLTDLFKKYLGPKKRIGIALGSGGAKGISHIGVLEVLEKNGIIFNEISGCSIGAIIGALYAAGVPISEIKKIALKIDFFSSLQLFDFTKPKEGGIVKGHIVEDFLDSILPVKTFENLKYSFKCIATDINKGKGIIFNKGDLIPAIRASISIPGFFVPYKYQNGLFIDGAVVNPVPVDLLTESDYKIAVIVEDYELLKKFSLQKKYIENKINNLLKDIFYPKLKLLPLTHNKKEHKKADTIKVLSSALDIISNKFANYDKSSDADLIIKPDVHKIPVLAFYKGKKSYKEGVKAAKKVLFSIKKDLCIV